MGNIISKGGILHGDALVAWSFVFCCGTVLTRYLLYLISEGYNKNRTSSRPLTERGTLLREVEPPGSSEVRRLYHSTSIPTIRVLVYSSFGSFISWNGIDLVSVHSDNKSQPKEDHPCTQTRARYGTFGAELYIASALTSSESAGRKNGCRRYHR